MMFSKDGSSSGGETLCSCRFCSLNGFCILDDMYHHKVGVCKDYQEYKEVKHQTCLYVVDSIYLDQASTNLYHLFLHCEWCGKPIKLCVKTENNIVNWLGGAKKTDKFVDEMKKILEERNETD